MMLLLRATFHYINIRVSHWFLRHPYPPGTRLYNNLDRCLDLDLDFVDVSKCQI